jgi:hypothetical protein
MYIHLSIQAMQMIKRSRNCLPCTSTLFFIGVRLIFLVFCVVFFFCLVCLHPVSCAPMLPVSLPCVLCTNVASVSTLCRVCQCCKCLYPVSCAPMLPVSTLCLVHQCCKCLYPVSCAPMLPVSLPCVVCDNVASVSTLCLVHQCCQCLPCVLCTNVASVSTLCLVHQCCQCFYPVHLDCPLGLNQKNYKNEVALIYFVKC